MPNLKFIFLVAVLALTSGYRFRCYAFCTDQTSVQDEYTEQRDHCRQYAQLKSETSTAKAGSEFSRKGQLISLFSECMGRNGWTVPDGKEGLPKTAGPAPAAAVGAAANSAATAPPQDPAATAAEDKAFIARASECSFARQAADSSSISATRAQACDIECAQRLRAAPDAPKPAACPAEIKSGLSKGNDKEE